MDRFFDANNPIMRFLARLVDLVILNVLTLVCCLPVVTIGPSLSAMNYVLIHYAREEETYTWKMFRSAFQQNLKQGIPLGLIYILLGIIGGADLWLLRQFDTKATTGLMLIITFLGCYILAVAVYTFGLQSRFHNTIRETLVNAIMLSLGHLIRTLGMIVIWAAWVLFLWYLHKASPLAIVLYGVTLPGYLCTYLYDPIFRKMEEIEH